MCSRKNRISGFGRNCGKSAIRNQAGDGPECGSAVHRECPAGKDEVQPEEHKEFFVPGRYATMFRTVFAVMGKEYK